MQSPACPLPPPGTRTRYKGQVHHTALGTKGRARGWAQPPPGALLLVSSVPVCSQRPKHLAEEGAVEWQSLLPPSLGSLKPGIFWGSAEILRIQTQAQPSTLCPGESRTGPQDWRGSWLEQGRDEHRVTPGNFGKTRSSLEGWERAEQVLPQSLLVSGNF
jgi:hypothetical protein